MDKGIKLRHLSLDLICAVLLIVFDQYTKNLAVIKLKDKTPFVLIDKVFELNYLENRGAAFGMMQNKQWFFLIVSVFFVSIIVFILYRMPVQKKFFIAEIILVLLLSGAIGNMIDRIMQDYVVDFIYISYINFPIFNVADMYVSICTVALAIILLFKFKETDYTELEDAVTAPFKKKK